MWQKRRPQTLKKTRPPLTTFFNHKGIGKSETIRDLIIRLAPTLNDRDKQFFGEVLKHPDYQPYAGVRNVIKDRYIVTDHYPWYRKEEIRVPMPKDKIIKGVIPQNVKDAMPIRPSHTALWRGFVNQPVGAFPQKFTHTDPVFKEINQTVEGKRWMYEAFRHTQHQVHASGGWDTQRLNMQELCDPVVGPDLVTLIEAAESRFDKVKLPFIEEGIDVVEVLNVGTNPTSNPGFVTSRLVGINHKESDKVMKPIAAEVFEIASVTPLVDRTLWSVGGRGRNFKSSDVGTEIKSRVVLMPESVPKIISLAVSGPWMDSIVKINKDFPQNEIGVGIDFQYGNFEKFNEFYRESRIQIELDWKGFDTKVSEEELVVAFGVLRACYPDGEKYDNLFYYMATGTIFKNVVIPGGWVYTLTKAIPSGSPWTTALGCIVNWLNWGMILRDVTEDNRVCCYGDDSLAGIKEEGIFISKYKEDTIQKWIDERCCLVSKKTRVYDSCGPHRDVDDQPSILKTYSYYGLPARKKSDLYERLIFGGKIAEGINDRAMRTTGAFYNSPHNDKTTDKIVELRYIMEVLSMKKRYNSPVTEEDKKKVMSEIQASRRFGEMRFVSMFNVFTPRNKTVVPWLDKQRHYEKNFEVDNRVASKMFSYLGVIHITDILGSAFLVSKDLEAPYQLPRYKGVKGSDRSKLDIFDLKYIRGPPNSESLSELSAIDRIRKGQFDDS